MKKLMIFMFSFIAFFLFNMNVKAYEKTIDDGVYIIHSSINENYVLDANGGFANNGVNVQLYFKNNGLSQKWIVRYLNDGYYEITSTINDNYALDVNGAVFNNSVNIQLWKKNGSTAQKWIIKETDNGYYKIISYNTDYSLDACGAVATNFTNIQLWKNNTSLAQEFKFEKYSGLEKTIENGIYTISTALDNSKVIDIYGDYLKNSTNIQLYQSHGGDGQNFFVNYLGNGYYSIRSYQNVSYSLDVFNNEKNPGTNVELYGYAGGSNQQWIINQTEDGYFNIISRCNYLVMDVSNASTKNETNILMYTKNNQTNQKFKFNKAIITGTKTIDNGYYFINSSINSKKVLDVNNGVMESNRNVEIYTLNYGINQKWKIEYLNDGYYKILCNKDNSYGLQVDGSNINIGKYTGLKDQQWIIKKSGNFYYLISKSGKYVDLYYGDISNGTNIQPYNFNGGNGQRFNFLKTADGISNRVIEDGIYRIASALDMNMFVDVYGGYSNNGTNIHLWYRNSGNGQKYRITYLSNGYYKISTLLDLTKVFDVAYGSIRNGANLSIFSDSNSINQQWIIKDAGNGYFNIISNCNNLYVDVEGGKTIGGTNILLWSNNNSTNQKFKFIKAEKETRVIDVSYHQGQIDWNKVYNSGIYGVILRIGYWNTEDSRFKEYISEVKRLGIPYGIYLFSYASTTNGVNIEADFTKEIIKKYNLNPTLGIYYDLEDWYTSPNDKSDNLSKEQYDSIALNFINSVSSYVGNKYKVKIYANLNYINNRLGNYAKSQVDWVAQYYVSNCGYKGSYSLWQYTDSETLDGINGFVDMNYLY